MEKFNLFLPLTKVDVAQRLVTGTLTAEVVDKADEIMDYETGKPEFEKWSAAFKKTTDGKSLGNVRAMHSSIAAGKFTEINYDDVSKTITGTAKIVDDAEWKKVQEGVYTGFSIGGKYKKRWEDKNNPGVMRFTPEPAEVSIVDNPCVAEATFSLIRADGAVEMRKFKAAEKVEDKGKPLSLAKQFEGVPEPEQVWKANDGSTHASKEAAFKKNAELAVSSDPAQQLLGKLNAALDNLEIDPETLGKKDFSDEKRKKLAETGAAMEDGSFPIEDKQDLSNAIHAFGRAKDKAKAKAHIIARAKALGEESMLPENWHKDGKGDHKDDGSEKSFNDIKMKKGLHEVARGACLIQELEWLVSAIEWEQAAENDNESTQPDELKHIITTLCTWLENAVEEECREIVEPHAVDLMEMAVGLPEDHAKALSKYVLKTATTQNQHPFKLAELLQKAGARHSKADAEYISKAMGLHGEMEGHMDKMKKALGNIEDAHDDIRMTHRAIGKCMGKSSNPTEIKEFHEEMHGHIKRAQEAHSEAEDVHGDMEETHEMLGKCMKSLMPAGEKSASGSMQKVDNSELQKVQTENVALKNTVDTLTDGLQKALKRIEVIEKQPQPLKGALFAVGKGHEVTGSGADPFEAGSRGEPEYRPAVRRI